MYIPALAKKMTPKTIFGFWKQVIFRFHTVDGWNPAPPGMYETL